MNYQRQGFLHGSQQTSNTSVKKSPNVNTLCSDVSLQSSVKVRSSSVCVDSVFVDKHFLRSETNCSQDKVKGKPKTVNFNDKSSLKVIFSNVDTLSNKCAELEAFLCTESPHIIGLCEIYPKFAMDKTASSTLNLPNYEKFTPNKQGDRGIVLYIHKSLSAFKVDILSESDFKESVWCEISLKDRDKLLLGCVYRSPSSTSFNNGKLNELIDKACDLKYSHFMLLGDFNYPEIDWQNKDVTTNPNSDPSKFFECIQDNFLFQHIVWPTRFRTGQIPNILDLVFTNEEDMIPKDSIKIDSPIGKSDHSLIIFDFMCYMNNNIGPKDSYSYFKGNYEGFINNLNNLDWDSLFEDKSVDEMWTCFNDIMSDRMNQYIPKKKINNTFINPPLWMDRATKAAIIKKRKSWKHYKYSRSRVAHACYVKDRNDCTRTVKNAKYSFERKVALEAKANVKSFWNYVNSKLKTRSGIGTLEKPDGSLATSTADKVEVLNNFFTSVFTRTPDLQNFDANPNIDCKLDSINITMDMVIKKLNQLKTDKSAGPDGLHPKVLYEVREAICYPLYIIFCKSVNEGTVPDEWKKAIVSPIFKKGKKTCPGNYRPVSLTSVVCKILESIIRDSFMEYLMENNLFTDSQYGFRPGRSCVTQLLEVLDEWSDWMDSGFSIDTIYLDFSKAFDSVPHQRLFLKLEKLGFSGTILDWIKSFLLNRKQSVRINKTLSSWSDVVSGVPQGSVLGPVLFLIFINDLPDTIDGIVKIFADDCKAYTKISSVDDSNKLQENLDLLCDWSNIWKLNFNASKCKVMHINPGTSDDDIYNYTMLDDADNNVALSVVTEEKDLGVTFEPNLKFEKHITNIINKAQRILALIHHSFDCMDQEMFIILYKSIIRPLLEYGTCIWSPYLKKDIRRLEAVQRRATKFVKNISHLSYEERLRALGLPTLEYRRERNDMLQIYRALHGIDDIDCSRLFTLAPLNITRGHNWKLFHKQCRTTQRLNSFSIRVVDRWNSLSSETVSATSLNAFKSALNNENWSNCKFTNTC